MVPLVCLPKDDCTAAGSGGSEPAGCSTGRHSQRTHSHGVKQVLDVARVCSAAAFYSTCWHQGSLFRRFFTRFPFCLSAERWLLASFGQADPWTSNTPLVQLRTHQAHGAVPGQQNDSSTQVTPSLCQGDRRALSRLALVGTTAARGRGDTAEQLCRAEWMLR